MVLSENERKIAHYTQNIKYFMLRSYQLELFGFVYLSVLDNNK